MRVIEVSHWLKAIYRQFGVITAGGVLLFGIGQAFCLEPVTLRSSSGQFFVRGLPLGAPLLAPGPNDAPHMRVDPTLLGVSCERIKTAVLTELGLKDLWRGRIFVSLHPVNDDNEPIVVTSVHYKDGWSYRMEIPERVDGNRLVKSVVQILLMELANRNSRSLAADLPMWLTEGVAAHLQATILSNFTLEPETRIARRERGLDPLALVRDQLQSHPGLSLNQLNWPAEEDVSEQNLPTYQRCAQLFVYELLRLRDGRACLRNMLAWLPENLNWQTAFLRAFNSHFKRLIDVDKWWSLHLVHLTGQGFVSAWVREEFCRQLEDILVTPVQVRLAAQELPLTIHFNVQKMLAEWDFPRQESLLRQKLTLLQALRLRVNPDCGALLEAYRQTIDFYLQQGSKSGGDGKGNHAAKINALVTDTIKRLDELDSRKESLRKQTNNAPESAQLNTAK